MITIDCLGCDAGLAHRHIDAEDGPRAECCDHNHDTFPIGDGRMIVVEPIGGDACCATAWGILIDLGTDADMVGRCVINGSRWAARREAARIAAGIAADAAWFAR